MTMVISGSDGVTFPDSTNQFSGGAFSFKNRIINGDMRIDQRNAGASVTLTSGGVYTVDRWFGTEDSDGAMTAQQDSSVPTGFVNSVKCTTTTADGSLSGSQFVIFGQKIEGLNVADLGWGTANAKTITVSFWVRSSLTGTFGGAINNSGSSRSYPFTYSISVADTWEQKSVTIAGDTTGTWLTTSGLGLQIVFGLGVGSTLSGTAGAWASANYVSATGATSVIGTLNATFYITGVQLEAGSVATPFERRPFGTELALCQRYCYAFTSAGSFGSTPIVGANQSTTLVRTTFSFPTTMRGSPTTTFSAANTFLVQEINGAANRTVSAVAISSTSNQNIFIDFTISSGTAGASVLVFDNNANAKITVSSEL